MLTKQNSKDKFQNFIFFKLVSAEKKRLNFS